MTTLASYSLSFAISPDQSRFAIIYAHGGLEVYSISSAFIAACIAWDPPSDNDNFPVDVCFILNNSLVIGNSRRRRLVLANIDGMDIMTTVVDLRRAGRQRGRIVFVSICHIVTYSCLTRALSRLVSQLVEHEISYKESLI